MVITSSGVVISDGRRNAWERFSRVERFLVIYVPVTLIILFGLAAYLIITGQNKDIILPGPSYYCSTPGCVQASARMLKYMNQSVNPCDNLYEFACGGYFKNVYIQNSRNKINALTQIADLVPYQLREIFEEPSTSDELRPLRFLKQMYQNCMNVTNGSVELDYVKAMLEDIAGGWPVLKGQAWNANKFDWQKSVYKFRKYGLSINNFITFDVIDDPKNASRKILSLDAATLGFSPENLLIGAELKAYNNYLVNLAVKFGAIKQTAENAVRDMINFQINLGSINSDRIRESSHYTIEQLQAKHPTLNWLELINYAIFLPDKALQGGDTVLVTDLSYVDKLESLLNETPKSVQANHVIFQTVTSLLPYLSESFKNLERKFTHVTEEELPRWKLCTNVTAESLKIAAGSLYVSKYFNIENKIKVTRIADSIKNNFIKVLSKVPNEEALEKLNSLKLEVAYHDEILKSEELENDYGDFKTVTDNYLLFMGNLSLFITDKKFKKLFEPPGESSWQDGVNPINVEVTYSSSKNTLEIPAAVLQGTFFDGSHIDSLNYGGIGFYVGQVLSKALVNVENIKGENCTSLLAREVQDVYSFTGLELTYLALQPQIRQSADESQLFGLNYNLNQLFWISAAQSRCQKCQGTSIQENIYMLSFDYSKSFLKDFECKEEPRLNSVDNNCKIL